MEPILVNFCIHGPFLVDLANQLGVNELTKITYAKFMY